MRHYRRRRYRRKSQNLIWQPVQLKGNWGMKSNTVSNTVLGTVTPGRTTKATGQAYNSTPFDEDAILERIRGTIHHEGSGALSGSHNIIPVTFAAVKIPAGLGGDNDIDLFATSDGDDFPLYVSHVCDVGTGTSTTLNEHNVDSKAKRKFHVGDVLKFFASALMDTFSGTGPKIEFCINLRILWRLP